MDNGLIKRIFSEVFSSSQDVLKTKIFTNYFQESLIPPISLHFIITLVFLRHHTGNTLKTDHTRISSLIKNEFISL